MMPSASPTIRLRVFDDPAHRWEGIVYAEFTDEGLLLHGLGEDGEYLVPFDRDAQWPCSTYLKLPCKGRMVIFTVAQAGVDQVRLARDLGEWLQRRRSCRIDLKIYRLPAYLRLFALLPLILPVTVVWYFLHMPFSEVSTMIFASAPGISVAVLLFWWSFAGFPSVRARITLSLFLALVCNGIVATSWVHHEGRLLDVFALLPGGPGGPFAPEEWSEFADPRKKFTIEMPGQPKETSLSTKSVTKIERVIKTESQMYGLNFKHTSFTVGYVDLPGHWKHLSVEQRLDKARQEMFPEAKVYRVDSEEIVTHQGNPGRDYHIFIPKVGNLVLRHLIVGDRFYVFMAGAPRYSSATPDVQRFLSSFRLTKS